MPPAAGHAAVTFIDMMARLRQHFWFGRIVMAAVHTDMTEPISLTIQHIVEAACGTP
ncbi:MAG: hypothetical protein ACRYHQ_34660 [Janthinobacterium lividum]